MPRCPLFDSKRKSKSLPEEATSPAARANMQKGKLNMLEGKLDVTALLPPMWTATPMSPTADHSTNSRPTTFGSEPVLEGQNRASSSQLEELQEEPAAATMINTSNLSFLHFRPVEGVDYARSFARAVLEGYRSNLFPGASQKDRMYAERVVQGEGRSLVFRSNFIAKNALWDGKDPRLRRAAFVHILGVPAAECKVADCVYGGKGCANCEGSGMFEGCRHSHEMSKKLRCGNCEAGDGSSSAGCSSRHSRKDSKDVYQEIRKSQPKVLFPSLVEVDGRKKSSAGLIEDSRKKSSAGLIEDFRRDSKSKRPSQIGPVLNDFFVARKEGIPSDFDIWMTMRKRAIDYEPGVLAMECRLAKLWSSVLEDELGKQKAAGLQEGG